MVNVIIFIFNIIIRIAFCSGMLYISFNTSGWQHMVSSIIGFGYLGYIIITSLISKAKETYYLDLIKRCNNSVEEIKQIIEEAKEKMKEELIKEEKMKENQNK